ncbi:MAG: hypothetical protein K8I82_29270, partial [Anaerolineae bacterium]|nr:hypothetical protein [Anaerolineae bacterium]
YGADDHPYCENCFFETFDYCRECGETHYMEDLIYVEDEGEYCEYCFDRYAVTCENCGTHVLRRWADSRGDKWYCENCTPES